MKDETKQIFTRKITQANKTQLTVIVYEILLVYLEDSLTAFEAGNKDEFKHCLSKARECISELRISLDFNYEPSASLFSIYCFADRELAKNIYGNKINNIHELQDMFTKLKDAFEAVSKNDNSKPLMENIQGVYAGLTYGKNDLNENLVNYDSKRGYLV